MTVIKINAITVPEGSGDELGKRFAARQSSMAGTPGFEGFELLQPTDGRNQWLVITRWAGEEAFEAWKSSQDFQRAHGTGRAAGGAESAASHPADGGHAAPEKGAGTESAGDAEQAPAKPVGVSSELWSYTVSVTG